MPPGFKYTAKQQRYITQRRAHWQKIASDYAKLSIFSKTYHKRLQEVHGHLIPQGRRVLEIGCGNGDLLASLKPSFGVGVDISHEMLLQAKRKYSDLSFIEADGQFLPVQMPFDYIILSDLVNDLWDVQTLFEDIMRLSAPHTRIILNTYSRIWQPILSIAYALKMARPPLIQNWLSLPDLKNLLEVANYEPLHTWQEMLLPLPIPFINSFFNKYLTKIWPFNLFCLSNFLVARPRISPAKNEPSITVVVPARNEAGNITDIFTRIA